MVKAPHAKVSFERAFFLVRSRAEFDAKAAQLLAAGIVTREGIDGAVIEEFALGPTVNLNFFYSPLLDELELLGTDTRRQTNLDGLRGLPFSQAQQLADEPVRMEEAGHIATTLTESMLEKAFDMGEKFVRATQKADPPGIIGPFALQCVIVAGPPKEFRLLRRLDADSGLARDALYAVHAPIAGAAISRSANELRWKWWWRAMQDRLGEVLLTVTPSSSSTSVRR